MFTLFTLKNVTKAKKKKNTNKSKRLRITKCLWF